MTKRLGALVVFREGVLLDEARDELLRLARREVIEFDNEQCSCQPEVHEFDPETEGWPVWFIS